MRIAKIHTPRLAMTTLTSTCEWISKCNVT